jgi:uncharacterized protein (DUF1697 family)
VSTYVALLRAINVTGRNKIAMADLRGLFEDLGYADVTTYLQSGNVVFGTRSARTGALADAIEHRIDSALGLEVAVLVRTPAELEEIAADNPYLRARVDPTSLHVVFLEDRATAAAFADIDVASYAPDACALHGREVYVSCPAGYGRTKLNNAFFERRLGTRATTRNWKTLTSLVELAQG